MLFLSRYYGLDKYGVVDTDDGVEEFVDRQMLIKACIIGVEIEGSDVHRSTVSAGAFMLTGAAPWQDIKSLTPLQVKTKMILKVDVVTYNGMITNILWEPDEIMEPVTLRLSDFAGIVADRVFFGNAPCAMHKITVILDDKLELLERALLKPNLSLGVDGLGIIFDLRDIKSEQLARRAYRQLFYKAYDMSIDRSIIDDEDRKHRIVIDILNGVK